VALIRTDVSEACIASIIRMTTGDVGTTLIITANVHSSPILVTLMMEATYSYKNHTASHPTRRNSATLFAFIDLKPVGLELLPVRSQEAVLCWCIVPLRTINRFQAEGEKCVCFGGVGRGGGG
jgi:hypothetical protein